LLEPLPIPGGVALAGFFDEFTIQWQSALPMLPIGMALYYRAWKYLVAFLNGELRIAYRAVTAANRNRPTACGVHTRTSAPSASSIAVAPCA
jgi:hypothetical protein